MARRNIESEIQEDKKIRERFEKLASKPIKSIKSKFRAITSKDIQGSSKTLERSYSKFTKFTSPNFDNVSSQDSAVDVGFSDNSLGKNVLYTSDQDSGRGIKKMRKLTPSGGGGLVNLIKGNSRIFNEAFSKQASLMTKLHSERMEATLRLQNSQIKQLQSIGDHLQKMHRFQSTVQTEYYKNNLQTQHNILQELRDINKHLKAGFNLDDKGRVMENKQAESIAKMLFKGGNFRGNLKKAGAKVVEQLLNDSTGGASMMLPLMMTYFQNAGPNEIIGDSVKSLFAAGAGRLMSRRNNERISGWMQDPGTMFEAMMNNWQIAGTGWKQSVGKLLGTKGLKKGYKGVDLTQYLVKDAKDRATFDQMAHTALTKVIPTALAKIQASLSKGPELHYNYKTNRYETLKEAERSLKTGYSSDTRKAVKNIEKQMYGYHYRDSYGTKKYREGVFESLSKKEYDKVTNIDVVRTLIKTRPREIGTAMMKLMLFYSQYDANVGVMLQNDNLTVERLIPILYPEVRTNSNTKWTDDMISSATAFLTFIDTLRNLPKTIFTDIWGQIVKLIEDLKNLQHKDLSRAMDGYYSNAQFASYTGKTVMSKSGVRTLSEEERKKEYDPYEVGDLQDILGVDPIDLSGVLTPEAVKKQIADKYNAVLQPLFKGSHDNIKRNLKAKIQEYKKKDPNHMFLKPMEKLLKSFDQAGDIFSEEKVMYTPDEAYNLFKKDKEIKTGPQFEVDGVKGTIESAKNVAKWHIENNPKVRASVGIGGTAAYGLLVKSMAEKSGMTGPLTSSIIGTAAAVSLAMSGRLTKMMDIMATDVGDEKMLRKDGTESNVTKREALNEAMYREMLPKAWGYNTGMKIGGWVRNNVRFGPILGPVIGMSTGFLLAKTSGWIVKVAGLFGKMGKGILNFAGRKITGNEDANWGNMARDLIREKLGLPPIGSDTFSVKEIMRQTGKQGNLKGTRWDNFAATFTGQTGDQIAQRRFNRKWREELERKLRKNLSGAESSGNGEKADLIRNKLASMEESGDVSGMNKIEAVIKQGKTGSILEDELFQAVKTMEEEETRKAEARSKKRQPWYDRTLQVRVIGGHLDAVGTVGMIDGLAYQRNIINMRRQSTSLTTAKKTPDQREQEHLKKTDTFLRKEKLVKEAIEQQANEEVREVEQHKDIDVMAKAFDPENPESLQSKIAPKKEEKGDGIFGFLKKGLGGLGGIFGGLLGGLGGLGSALTLPALGLGLGYLLLGPDKMNKGMDSLVKFLDPMAKGLVGGAFNLGGKALGTLNGMYSKDMSGGISRAIDYNRGFNFLTKGGSNNIRNHILAYGYNSIAQASIAHGKNKALKRGSKLGQKALSYSDEAMEKMMRYADNGIGIRLINKATGEIAGEGAEASLKTIAKKGATEAVQGKKMTKMATLLTKLMDKIDDVLIKIPGFKKIGEKIGKIGPGLLKIFKELLEKYGPKFLKEGVEKFAKSSVMGAIKGGLTASGVGIILNVGFIAWDALQGAGKAKEFFAISKEDKPTFLQKLACSITYAALSAIESVPGLFIISAIVSSLDFIMKHLCHNIYYLLDSALDAVGMGDNEEEAQEMQILDSGMADITGSDSDVKNNYANAQNTAQQHYSNPLETSHMFGGFYTGDGKALENKGGSGGEGGTPASPNKMISGKLDSGPGPTGFVSQNSFGATKLGSGNLHDDGCSLAVMKMISSFMGLNVPDHVMISSARNHLLPDRSVSIAFFSDFGGAPTSDKEEIKQALKIPGTAMAILTRGHFIAVLVKDRGHIWVGDPLKEGWEIMSSNSAKIAAHATAVAIFSNSMIVTGMTKPKGGRGPRKIGGFGTEAKALQPRSSSSRSSISGIRERKRPSGIPEWERKANEEFQRKLSMAPAGAPATTTSSVGTFTSAPVPGGLSFQANQVKNNGGWSWESLPNVQGRGYANLKPLIDSLSGRFNIPADTITALMALESNLNPGLAPNKYGYAGLGQFRRDSWTARISEGSYNGKDYGIKPLGQGGDLYNARQSGTLYTMTMAHDAKQLARKGVSTVTAGHLHLGHMLPTTKNYYHAPGTLIQNMKGVTRKMIDANYPILAAGGKKGGASATLQQALDQDNAILAKKLAEHKGSVSKGGRGAKYRNSLVRWGAGGGAIPNVTIDILRNLFFTENASGLKDLFKNPGSKVLCGVATIMNLARIGRYNSFKTDGKPKIWDIQKFVDKYKYYDKDKGVKSTVFTNHFNGTPYPLELANGMGPNGSFGWLSQMTKGGKKSYRLQHGDVCVYLDITGHYRIIVGLGNKKYAILNPSMHKVEVIGETFLENANYTKVTWACYWNQPGQISISGDLLNGKREDGNRMYAPGGEYSSKTSSTSTELGDGTGANISTDGETGTGTTVTGTPQTGTSAKFGGYYFRDKDGNLKQLTFKIHQDQQVGVGTLASGSTSSGTGTPILNGRDLKCLQVAEAEFKAYGGKTAGVAQVNRYATGAGLAAKTDNKLWCSIFVSYCMKQQFPDYPSSESSQHPYLDKKNFTKIDKPRPGAAVVWYQEHLGGNGHIALVAEADEQGNFKAYGGNPAVSYRSYTAGNYDYKLRNGKPRKFGGFYLYKGFTGSTSTSTTHMAGVSGKTAGGIGGDKVGADGAYWVGKNETLNDGDEGATGLIQREEKAAKGTSSTTSDKAVKNYVSQTKSIEGKMYDPSYNASRNMNIAQRDRIAMEAKMEMYNKAKGGFGSNHDLGPLSVSYDRDTAINRSAKTGANILKDTGNPILGLLGQLVDVTVDNRNTLRQIYKETDKQTKIQESTEKAVEYTAKQSSKLKDISNSMEKGNSMAMLNLSTANNTNQDKEVYFAQLEALSREWGMGLKDIKN